MTRADALSRCHLLWANLATTGSDDKFAAAEQALGYVPPHACPACEYTITDAGKLDCTMCPISAWRTAARDAGDAAPCLDYGPYADWALAETTDLRKAAAKALLQLIAESPTDED